MRIWSSPINGMTMRGADQYRQLPALGGFEPQTPALPECRRCSHARVAPASIGAVTEPGVEADDGVPRAAGR
jgi:hypothetical protein